MGTTLIQDENTGTKEQVLVWEWRSRLPPQNWDGHLIFLWPGWLLSLIHSPCCKRYRLGGYGVSDHHMSLPQSCRNLYEFTVKGIQVLVVIRDQIVWPWGYPLLRYWKWAEQIYCEQYGTVSQGVAQPLRKLLDHYCYDWGAEYGISSKDRSIESSV